MVETDDVEAVGGLEAGEGEGQAGLGLTHGEAAHGAGIVDHQDHLSGAVFAGGRLNGRRGEEGQEVIGGADRFPEEADSRGASGGRLPGELEIAVGWGGAGVEFDDAGGLVDGLGFHRVIGAFDGGEREPRGKADLDRYGIDRSVAAGVEVGGLDAIAIGHGVGDGSAPTVGAEIDGLHEGLRIVAGRDHERDAQGKLGAGATNGLLVLDLDDDRLARADVGHGVGEDVGALLLDQGRLAAFRLGALVDDLGGVALLDGAEDDALANHHLQGVDGGALGQRVDVDGLDMRGAGVGEHLRDASTGCGAGDGDVIVGAETGGFDVAAIGGTQQEAAGTHLAGRCAFGGGQGLGGRLKGCGGGGGGWWWLRANLGADRCHEWQSGDGGYGGGHSQSCNVHADLHIGQSALPDSAAFVFSFVSSLFDGNDQGCWAHAGRHAACPAPCREGM